MLNVKRKHDKFSKKNNNRNRMGHFYFFVLFLCFVGGRSYSGINEEIMWATIIMGIIIAILITMALCYLAREKYRKREEYYVNA